MDACHDPGIPRRAAAVSIDWLRRRDLPAVLAIESDQFEFPWTERDFTEFHGRRGVIGYVAKIGDLVVGYAVCALYCRRMEVLNLAVAGDRQCQGIGRAIVGFLRGKLSPQRRDRIEVLVRERNVWAQKFFFACGFRATGLRTGEYDECHEDGIVFQYRLDWDAETSFTRSRGDAEGEGNATKPNPKS